MNKYWPRLTEEQRAKMYADLKRLYVEYEGRNIRGLIAEMRRIGHAGFSTYTLYSRSTKHKMHLAARLKLKQLLPVKLRNKIDRVGTNRNFQVWLGRTKPEWTWTWTFQTYIYNALRRAQKRGGKRLMVFMPPRHGKSELVTIRYAAWRIERNPKTRVIVCCYNQKLANRFSRLIKRIVRERVPLSKERFAANEWETEAGGSVLAVGVGGGVAGFGADLIIVDDPVRNRADAESETNRETLWNWLCDDIHTRLEPDAMLVIIQTRWHEDDPPGRLIKKQAEDGEMWEVVSLPALAESDDPLRRREGEALCPQRFNQKTLEQKKRQMGSYSFAAMYQQRPIPREGSLFKPAYFANNIIEKAPDGLLWYRGYDLAVSTKTKADYTASFRVAKDGKGNIYIADGFRKRIEFPEQRKYITGRIIEERNSVHGIESALHGEAFVQELMRDERLVASAFRSVKVTSDKFTRALAWSGRAEAGKVFLVRGPWIQDFLDEAYTFPAGRHDDQIDAVSLAIQMISERGSRGHIF